MTATGAVRRLLGRLMAVWVRARCRFGWLDHLARATVRYDQADGGRLSAALTYYAFFATFALALLGFAVLGHVLDDPAALATVQRYLTDNIPRLDVQALRDARGTAGVIAFIALPLTGLFWIDTLRSAIRAIWQLPEYPGTFGVRQLIDLAMLTGLGLLLSASLAVAFSAQTILTWLALHTVGVDTTPARWFLEAGAFLLGISVNTLLAVALLTAPPRLRIPLRRVLGPALIITIGLEFLKTAGQYFLNLAAANPAYQVVAGAVGILIFLKIVNQLILFAAALTATGQGHQRGRRQHRHRQPARIPQHPSVDTPRHPPAEPTAPAHEIRDHR